MILCEATQPEPCGNTASPRAWKTTRCNRFHHLCEAHTQMLYGRRDAPTGVDLYALVPHGPVDGRYYCPDPPA